MNLTEAIKHCEEVADQKDKQADSMYPPTIELDDRYADCRDCAAEHRQLAEWLKDYRRLLGETKGKWIVDIVDDPYMIKQGWKCSVCGVRQANGIFNFCPQCGADMRGAKNETQ